MNKKILDVSIDLLNKKQVLDILEDRIITQSDDVFCVSPLNLELIMIAQKNKEFKNYLNNYSDLNTIDGVGILNVLKWYGILNNERVCGSDLVYNIAELCANHDKKYFILGASEEVSNSAKVKLRELFPNLNICNYSPPYTKELRFSQEENTKIEALIKDFRPDVLCVAFGAPKQELWIHEHQSFLNDIGVRIAIGLGGSFDFVSGRIPRAPKIFQKTGNEWIFRLLVEPKARFKRYATTIPVYYWLCFLEFIKSKCSKLN